MHQSSSQPMVLVNRGPISESVHHGYVSVVHIDRGLTAFVGDASHVTFARSTAKLLQAIPLIESGAADRYGLTDAELAIACASHNGETLHVETVYKLLAKMNLSEQLLQCGPHAPFHKPTAQRMMNRSEPFTNVHNNCSGKHSGMLAIASHIGAPLDSYMDPAHPVQRLMLKAVADMSGLNPSDIVLGTDGCGVPVFGLGLDRLALAFARLGAPESLPEARAAACRRIVKAVRAYPDLLAGDDRFDTHLIRATQGRMIGKLGAEAVFVVSVPDQGLGIAVKIEDGSLRGLYPAVVETLIQLDLLSDKEREALAPFHRPKLRNWRGDLVGEIVPDFGLQRRS